MGVRAAPCGAGSGVVEGKEKKAAAGIPAAARINTTVCRSACLFPFPPPRHHHCRTLARQCPERATRAGVASGSGGKGVDSTRAYPVITQNSISYTTKGIHEACGTPHMASLGANQISTIQPFSFPSSPSPPDLDLCDLVRRLIFLVVAQIPARGSAPADDGRLTRAAGAAVGGFGDIFLLGGAADPFLMPARLFLAVFSRAGTGLPAGRHSVFVFAGDDCAVRPPLAGVAGRRAGDGRRPWRHTC